jgi:hypothetical protein
VTKALPWIVGFLAAAVMVGLWGLGSPEAGSASIVLGGVIGMALIARTMRTPADAAWLVPVVVVAYLAKIVVSVGRYVVAEVIYETGDAFRYHAAGIELVHVWRSLEVPALSIGTRTVEGITGLLYVPYVPTIIGGFFIFATVAFLGQLLFYAAFRRSVNPRQLPWYAAAVFFLPAIVYWPSSIGKESLMFLFIGLSAYGASGLLYDFRLRWAVVFATGVTGCAVIRPHVALMIVVALALALVISRSGSATGNAWRKGLAVLAIGVVLVVAGNYATRWFGLDLTSGTEVIAGAENVIAEVERRTTSGGSSVDGGSVSNPLEFPAGALKVLFRPLPYEAHNTQALVSSLESTLILLLVLWRIGPMVRSSWRIRRDPYLLFAALFTLGFIVAFSSFNNLGNMARQRSQVMPFFIALVVGLGWGVAGSRPGSGTRARTERTAVEAGS